MEKNSIENHLIQDEEEEDLSATHLGDKPRSNSASRNFEDDSRFTVHNSGQMRSQSVNIVHH